MAADPGAARRRLRTPASSVRPTRSTDGPAAKTLSVSRPRSIRPRIGSNLAFP